MAANLKIGFKERQCKRLSESIAITTPLAKKPCTEATQDAPTQDTHSILMPPTDAAESSNVLAAKSPPRKSTDPVRDGTFTNPALIYDDLDEKKNPVPLHTPGWEEMVEMLK